jgi:toxin CcdB
VARFEVFANRRDGLLLDVQNDFITGLNTRLVVPLVAADLSPAPIRRLHPRVVVMAREYVLATHLMASVPRSELGSPLGDLWDYYDEIVAALDMIFLGF